MYLGNLDAKRDWGYAPEYVEAIWRMVQQDSPDDFAIGTGECHSVKEFLQTAFAYVDLDWQKYVEIDERYLRPLEVSELQADASKALEILGWKPEITFHDLAHVMVDADLNAIGQKYPGLGKQAITEKSGTWHDWS